MKAIKYPTHARFGISEIGFLILSSAWASVLCFYRNTDQYCSGWKHYVYSKTCEEFRGSCPSSRGPFAWSLLLPRLHILPRSMQMLNVEVSDSCCSWLIEMVHNVSVVSPQTDFSPSTLFFYSLTPAVLMHLASSSETFGEINSWLHMLWKLWNHRRRRVAFNLHSFYDPYKLKHRNRHEY